MRDIEYKSIASGPAGAFQPGDVRHGVADGEASDLVKGGFASYVDTPAPASQAEVGGIPREQSTVAPAEQAVALAQPRTASRRGR